MVELATTVPNGRGMPRLSGLNIPNTFTLQLCWVTNAYYDVLRGDGDAGLTHKTMNTIRWQQSQILLIK